MQRHSTLCWLLLLVLFAACDNKAGKSDSSDAIAVINDKVLTAGQFQNAYSYYYRRTGYVLEPNSKNRNEVLRSEFDKLVLAQAAQDEHLDKIPENIFDAELIRRQYLVDLYQKEFVENKVELKEEQLRDLFVRANTRIHAAHLFAPTLDSALAIKSRLDKGESFETLAKEIFKNPYLAQNGGDLGEFGFDEMDIALEDAAMTLPLNSISNPIKTAQGYSVLKVKQRFTKPLITEHEYTDYLPRLRTIAFRQSIERSKREELKEFVDHVQLNESQMQQLWKNFDGNKFILSSDDNEFLGFISNLSRNRIELGRFDNVDFTQAAVLNELYYSPAMSRQRITDYRSFKNVLTGLMYRIYQIQKVNEYRLVEKTDFGERIKYAQLMDLRKKYVEELRNKINIPELDLFDYYQSNRAEMATPLQANFLKILVSDESKAKSALQELRKSRSEAQDLAILKKFTEDSESLLYGGQTGLQPIQNYGVAAIKLNMLQSGEVSEVIKSSENEFSVYKCIERVESKPMSFEEARPYIENMLKENELKKEVSSIIEKMMVKHDAKIFTEKVQTIALNINGI